MAPTREACAECTENCLLMHKKDKNPSPVATTFFKVMFGDDYAKIMYIPPIFARTIQHMVGKETQLEDPVGEKWTVKLKRVDGVLTFEDGWSKFSLDHGLKLGDFLVFHYIKESHFVVLMFGQSGCPEIQHFGFTRNQAKNTRKKGKFIAHDPSPSNMNTNGHYRSNKSSSLSERSEIRKKKRVRTESSTPPNFNITNAASSSQREPSVSNKEMTEPLVKNTRSEPDRQTSQRLEPLVKNTRPESDRQTSQRSEPLVKDTRSEPNKETSRRSEPLVKDTRLEPNKDTSERSEPLVKNTRPEPNKKNSQILEPLVHNSRPEPNKEIGQISDPLVKNMTPDKVVLDTPKSLEPFCLFERDTGNLEEEYRRSCLNDLSIFEVCESKVVRKNDIPAGGSEDETPVKESRKELAPQVEELVKEPVEKPKDRAVEKPKERAVEKPKERAVEKSKERAAEKPSGAATCHISIKKRLRNSGTPTHNMKKVKKELISTSNKDNPVETFRVTRASVAKKEPVSLSDSDTLGSRLNHVGSTSAFPGSFQKTMAKPMGVIKKEPTMTRGSDGCASKDGKTVCHNSVKKEKDDILLKVKPEPIDYDDSPLPGSGNTSFSAVMTTYQYLELPKCVKLQSKVILLRNGGDLWPALCRREMGLQALTYCWEAFAKAKGIQAGDECEFVLESEPNGPLSCSVFSVNVTRK